MAKVSVIIPVYNVEKYLDRCLNSVTQQTLLDIEIILIDDGSPDNCPQMCDTWAKKDNRIRVIHKVNAGLGMARNSGIEVATGDYIAFLDSDDYVDFRAYELLYKNAINNDLDVCYCDVIKFWEDNSTEPYLRGGSVLDFVGETEVQNFSCLLLCAPFNISCRVLYPNMAWNSLYKRSLFSVHKARFRSEREFVSEDLMFHLENLIYTRRIKWIPQPLIYHYMGNSASLTNNINISKIKSSLKMLYAVDRILKEKYELVDDKSLIFNSYLLKLTNDISVSIVQFVPSLNTQFKYLRLFLSSTSMLLPENNKFSLLNINKKKYNIGLRTWAGGYVTISSILYIIRGLQIKHSLMKKK